MPAAAHSHDLIVIGGGIVGLATARALRLRRPDARIAVIEKEPEVARHQTGHNSGVIHAGVYYAPGSLKARLCKAGAGLLMDYCRDRGIPFRQPGKLIVATSRPELRRMAALAERAEANGLHHDRLDRAALQEAEPNVAGLAALRFAASGIVSYPAVCRALARDLAAAGVDLFLGDPVRAIREDDRGVSIETASRNLRAGRMIACAGLQSDRLVRMAGLVPDHAIIPFRGEYYALPPDKAGIVSHLIYPVPDPDLPFLGIHLTPMIEGGITLGPNAVLGLSREGYAKGSVRMRDLAEMARFRGFWSMLRANLGSGLSEMRNSLMRRHYLDQCRKYCPSLVLDDLRPYPAGIRAQAVDRQGRLAQDFVTRQTARMLHVLNAPSPAATSSLAIAEMLADQALPPDGRDTAVRAERPATSSR